MSAGAGRALRGAARALAAIALLVLAAWIVGPERLRAQLAHVDRDCFGAALLLAAAGQGVSVLRWRSIARIFGLRVHGGALALAYAQGMALNVVLPGATLGGDALRSVRLQAQGNPLGVSALTVLLDRLSGLWVLCALSLLTGVGLLAAVLFVPGFAASWLARGRDAASFLPALSALGERGAAAALCAYLAGLGMLCAIPWLPIRPRRSLPRAGAEGASRNPLVRAWERAVAWHDLARAQSRPLARSLWTSVVVQVLCACALWLCLLAAGGDAAYWQVQAVAAPVFIAGALPVSYGGFGARELAAVALFPLVGLPSDQGLAASALYGLVGVFLGLAAAPAFAVRTPGAGGPEPA